MPEDPLARDPKVATSLRLKRGALDALDELVAELNAGGHKTSRTEVIEAWMAVGLPSASDGARLLQDYRRWRAGTPLPG